jgi:hypothetical protein
VCIRKFVGIRDGKGGSSCACVCVCGVEFLYGVGVGVGLGLVGLVWRLVLEWIDIGWMDLNDF